MSEVATPMLNLFQRINEIRKELPYIQKDKSVSTGTGSYKAVTHDQVTGMIRNALINHGVVCVPSLVTSSMQQIKQGNAEGKGSMWRYDATYSFDFVNIDDPQDRIVITIEAHANDNADKAPGKAISYAKKYAVLKLFEIETGEDEESRYKEAEEFDLSGWSSKMEEATSRDAIHYLYLEAKKEAVALNDAPSLKVLGAKVKELLAKFPAEEKA